MRRAARRRRRKKSFTVVSPPLFGESEVGTILGDSEDSVVGRRLEVQLSSLTMIPTHTFIKCRLRVAEVRDGVAYSVFDGFEYFREYIRALFMKGTSFVDIYRDIVFEEAGFRVFAGVFTPKRINTSRKRAIRRAVYRVFDKYLKKGIDHFVRDAVYGVIDTDIHMASKKIYPIRWAGIIKMKRIK